MHEYRNVPAIEEELRTDLAWGASRPTSIWKTEKKAGDAGGGTKRTCPSLSRPDDHPHYNSLNLMEAKHLHGYLDRFPHARNNWAMTLQLGQNPVEHPQFAKEGIRNCITRSTAIAWNPGHRRWGSGSEAALFQGIRTHPTFKIQGVNFSSYDVCRQSRTSVEMRKQSDNGMYIQSIGILRLYQGQCVKVALSGRLSNPFFAAIKSQIDAAEHQVHEVKVEYVS